MAIDLFDRVLEEILPHILSVEDRVLPPGDMACPLI